MSLITLLLIVLVICVIMGLPQIGGSWHGRGYAPSGLLGIVLVIILVFFLLGRL